MSGGCKLKILAIAFDGVESAPKLRHVAAVGHIPLSGVYGPGE